MLGNEKYAGVYTYNNEVFTNTYPKIVPKELFEIVKNKLEENKYGKHSNDVQYLLKNIMTCGYCGKSITSESGTARNGTTKRYYKCSSRKRSLGKCRKTTVRKEEIENLVVDTTIKVLSNPSIINNIAEKILESHNQKSKDRTVLNLLLKERQETQRSINNILTAMEKGVITSSTKNRLEELESKLDIVEGKILFEQSQNKFELNKQDIIKYINKSINAKHSSKYKNL